MLSPFPPKSQHSYQAKSDCCFPQFISTLTSICNERNALLLWLCFGWAVLMLLLSKQNQDWGRWWESGGVKNQYCIELLETYFCVKIFWHLWASNLRATLEVNISLLAMGRDGWWGQLKPKRKVERKSYFCVNFFEIWSILFQPQKNSDSDYSQLFFEDHHGFLIQK